MKIGDVYVNKKDNSIIQIDSYATHMGKLVDNRFNECWAEYQAKNGRRLA